MDMGLGAQHLRVEALVFREIGALDAKEILAPAMLWHSTTSGATDIARSKPACAAFVWEDRPTIT